MPIERHGVHPKVKLNTGVMHSMAFSELDACIAAGLNSHEWLHGMRYSKEFKEMIVAWYDLKGHIRLAVEDARFRASKRK